MKAFNKSPTRAGVAAVCWSFVLCHGCVTMAWHEATFPDQVYHPERSSHEVGGAATPRANGATRIRLEYDWWVPTRIMRCYELDPISDEFRFKRCEQSEDAYTEKAQMLESGGKVILPFFQISLELKGVPWKTFFYEPERTFDEGGGTDARRLYVNGRDIYEPSARSKIRVERVAYDLRARKIIVFRAEDDGIREFYRKHVFIFDIVPDTETLATIRFSGAHDRTEYRAPPGLIELNYTSIADNLIYVYSPRQKSGRYYILAAREGRRDLVGYVDLDDIPERPPDVVPQYLVLFPFALVADVVTLPIQAVGACVFWFAMRDVARRLFSWK